jgi:hypothetical protein
MAIQTVDVELNGHPLAGATIRVYDEDAAKATTEFGDGDLATIYSDRTMLSSVDQVNSPLSTGSDGQVTYYAPSGSLHAVKASRTGASDLWKRDVEVLTSDPL